MADPERRIADLEPKIARMARRVARLPEDVDDIEQVARIAAWEAAAEHGDTVGEGFLVQRAKWAAQSEAAHLARQRHDDRTLEGLEHTLSERPHEHDLTGIDPAEVRAAVARLNVHHRCVIEHRYFAPAKMPTRSSGFQPNTSGLSVRATAEALRLKPTRVRTVEKHALAALRDDLAA